MVFQKRKSNADTTNFPVARDWASIKSIRQVIFKRDWRYILEKWQFDDDHSARDWLNIALKNKKLDDFKPPRVFWIEGNNMYFIMATAAKDWIEHSDELIESFSGKKRSFLSVFNAPLDVFKYKKGNGANSGVETEEPYYYKPDTIGTYYNYFFFYKLRSREEIKFC